LTLCRLLATGACPFASPSPRPRRSRAATPSVTCRQHGAPACACARQLLCGRGRATVVQRFTCRCGCDVAFAPCQLPCLLFLDGSVWDGALLVSLRRA
jgi:hypothetical protein